MDDRGKKLRDLIKAGCVIAPGSYDPPSAQLIQAAGFDAVGLGGAALTTTVFGRPNVGYATLTEYVAHARNVARAVDVPVIVDGETGFGNAIDIRRTVFEFAEAGVAAVHIEDQVGPWTTSPDRVNLVSSDDMCAKVRSAREELGDSNFVLIARSDALDISVDEVIARCNAYLSAGADMVFPLISHAMSHAGRLELLRRFAGEIKGPVVGHNPFGLDLTPADAKATGMKLYIVPMLGLGPALAAVRSALQAFKAGRLAEYAASAPPMSLADIAALTGTSRYVETAGRFGLARSK